MGTHWAEEPPSREFSVYKLQQKLNSATQHILRQHSALTHLDLHVLKLQTGPEGGGIRLSGAGDHQEPCQEILSVHQLPHLRVGQQGE